MRTTLVGFLLLVALSTPACGSDDDSAADVPDADAPDGDVPEASCVPDWPTHANDPTLAQQWCRDFWNGFCARAFGDCTGEVATPFADETQCREVGGLRCDTWSGVFVAVEAEACLAAAAAATCAEVADEPLDACARRYGVRSEAPDPAACTVIEPGSHAAVLAATDAPFAAMTTLGSPNESEPAQTFCLCLTAGDTVTIEVAPAATDPIGDLPSLYLLNPYGYVAAEGAYSGPTDPVRIEAHRVRYGGAHMIVVTAPPANAGGFTLVVTVG